MPSTNIPVKSATSTGADIGTGTAIDTVNGNNFVNDGQTLLKLDNTDATSKVVTIKVRTGLNVDGNTVADKTVSVPGTSVRFVKPLSTSVYGETVEITCPSNLVKVTPINGAGA